MIRETQRPGILFGADLTRLKHGPRIISAGLAAIAAALAAAASLGMPPAADGALHVDLAQQIARSWGLFTEPASHYPPLYHIAAAIGWAVAGVAGVQAVSWAAFGLTSLFTFLLVRELTRNTAAALGAQALVTFSPVMLWYSSLIFMEPAVTASAVAAIYYTLRLHRQPSRRRLLAAALALAVVVLIKQSGIPVALAVLLFAATSSRIGAKRAGVMAAIVLALAVGPYTFIYARTGAFTDPGQGPLSPGSSSPYSVFQGILAGGVAARQPEWSLELEEEVDSHALYEAGTVQHRARQVYWRNMFNWSRFTWAHTLYPETFNNRTAGSFPLISHVVNLSLIAGLAAAVVLARRRPQWRLMLLTLVLAYGAMTVGSDTKRYFLWVSVLSAPFVVLPYWLLWRRYRVRLTELLRADRYLGIAVPVAVAAAVIVAAASALPLLSAQFDAVNAFPRTQGGGFRSGGGIWSIRETASWIREQTTEDGTFVAASVYEWEYYSDRQDLFDEGLDYRLYFLPDDVLISYMEKAGAQYVVIRDNQIVEDAFWNHIEMVPRSFVERIERLYPLAYTSTYGDIRIFEVQQPGDR